MPLGGYRGAGIANISNWCTRSPQRPCDGTHITLTDTPTRCTGCKFTNNIL